MQHIARLIFQKTSAFQALVCINGFAFIHAVKKKSATMSFLMTLNKLQNKVGEGGRNLITDQLHWVSYVDFKVALFNF